jgi:hypothetical protein
MITPIDEFKIKHENKDVKIYFSKLPRYRGKYYVQMKALVCRSLRSKGMSLERIAEIVLGDKKHHVTVLHYLKNYRDIAQVEFISENYKAWIKEGLYPITIINDTYRKDKSLEGNKTGYIRYYSSDLKLEKL